MAKANGTGKKKEIESVTLKQSDPLLEKGDSDSIARADNTVIKTTKGGSTAPSNGGLPTPKKSRQEINLEQVSTVLRPSGAGVSADAGGSTMMTVTFSGTDNLIVGRESQTPVQGQARQSSPRYIRKDESIVRSIDNVANAQVYTEIEGPKKLSEDPASPQGYTGKEIPKSVLIQKLSGVSPAERAFAASVDLITRDQCIYVDKQIVENVTDPNVSPAYRYYFDEETGQITQGDAYVNVRQNFRPSYITVTLQNGVLTSLVPVSDDLSITGQSNEVINRSSPAALINRNKIEAARRKIEEKAGDPQKENFSALGRKINYPNGVLNLIKDYEIMTGAEVAASVRSLSHALSYQINKAAKDGHRAAEAAHEMAFSAIAPNVDLPTLLALGGGDKFDQTLLAQGGANLLVRSFDTPRKYTTRGDMLTISKSYRSFLEQGLNHLNSFRVPKDFMPYYNNVDFFSTIDRDYDESMPVYGTNFINLIHPRRWENCCTIGADLTDSKSYMIAYNDSIDFSVTELKFPLLTGIARYIARNARKIQEAAGSLKTPLTLKIPVQHSKFHITLWDQLVCASLSDMEYARQQAFRDLLQYEEQNGPAFDDLVNLDTEVTKAKFFTYQDFVTPLSVGKMSDEAAITWIFPETFSAWGKDTSGNNEVSFMMPWYFSDSSLVGYTNDLNEEDCFINYPMVRYGITHSHLMKFFKLKERDVRLSYDIVTDIPAMFRQSGALITSYSTAFKYSKSQSGPAIVCIEASGADFPTIQSIMQLPRELGLGFVPPAFYGRWTISDNELIPLVELDDVFDGSLSYQAYIWRSAEGNPSTSIGEGFASNVARGANFKQSWQTISAHFASSGADADARVCLSLNGMIDEDGVTEDESVFSPYPVANGMGNASLPSVISFNKVWFFNLHYLDFFLSPFDLACVEGTVRDGEERRIDPFEKAYLYGFIGFLPSEYTEDHRSRTGVADAAGLAYFEDYYHDSTPLLR